MRLKVVFARWFMMVGAVVLLGGCGPAEDGPKVVATKQAWMTPLSPAVQDDLRDRVWRVEAGT